MYLEACSYITDPTTYVPREEHPSGQVPSGDGSAIHAEKQPVNGKHAEDEGGWSPK